jgi:hypothetical protein
MPSWLIFDVGQMKSLAEFSNEHLEERLQGLAKNLFLANGQLYVPTDIRQSFFETYEEALRRGMPTKLNVERWILPTDPMPIMHSISIVRYSKRQWLEEFREGRIRFTTASKFAALENVAQRDDELQRSWHLANRVLTINGVEYPASNMRLSQPVLRKDGCSQVYHSLSFSLEESAKLQRAFSAEGYIVVHDYARFYEIVAEALRSRAKNSQWSSGSVTYYDDRTEPEWKNVSDIVFSKTVLFKYQREVRVAVFNPPVEQEAFELIVRWPAGLISTVRSF